jgi:hypothetical protein
MMLALVRPDSWNFPLFLHVLGAGVLVGAIGATVVIATRAPTLRRLLVRTIGFLVLPAWVLMRFAGQWIDSREDVPNDPAWLGIGFLVGDAGLLLLVITALIAWRGPAPSGTPLACQSRCGDLRDLPDRPLRRDVGDDDEAGLKAVNTTLTADEGISLQTGNRF